MFDVLWQRAQDGRYYGEWLVSGLGWTLALAVSGWALAFTVGVLVGVGRTSRSLPVALLARLYVELFRNIPVLVQMFLWYFVLPELLPTAAGDWVKQLPSPWGSFLPALICLGLYTAARIAEQVRAGIQALPKGQAEAAAALGLHRGQAYRLVVIPQALRLIVPSLTSEVMGIYKNTSVELTAQAHQISDATFQTFAAFGAATLIYLILALLAYQLMSAIDRRFQIPGNAVGKPKGRARAAAGQARMA
jgi:glutamate/aspartate transport system permease protein